MLASVATIPYGVPPGNHAVLSLLAPMLLSSFVASSPGSDTLSSAHRQEASKRADAVAPYDWDAIGKHMKAAYGVLEARHQNERPWVRLWRGNETKILDTPQWVDHVVTPGERVGSVAARYGVDYRELREWNHLRPRARIKAGDKLRVLATRLPVPRERVEHHVEVGETWESIAALYRVESRSLRQQNGSAAQPKAGSSIGVWYDPGAPWTVGREIGRPELLQLDIPAGALSYGRPDRGRILNGVQLPESPLYERRTPRTLWGSSHAIGNLMQAIADYRYDSGHQGPLVINSMSLQRGRRFHPHKSHQSGRDVDIALPVLPGVATTSFPLPDQVDWAATWALVRSLVRTNEVVYIFLDRPLQYRLADAGRAMGATEDELATILEVAQDRRKQAVVRHAKGHDDHLHVRFTCAPYEPKCSGSN